jgi:hypothetical protein
MHHPVAGATRRCPMQPSTPLGPNQVNVIIIIIIIQCIIIILVLDISIDPSAISLVRPESHPNRQSPNELGFIAGVPSEGP